MADLLKLPGVTYGERYVETGDGVSLLVMEWIPDRPELAWPMVLVPGWASIPRGWEDLLRVAAARQPLYYVETREKVSARFSRRERAQDFSIERCGADLAKVCEALEPPVEEQVIVAASLGGTLFLEIMKHGRFTPRGIFLISPTGDFPYPWWGIPFTYMPSQAFAPAIEIVLFYLRHFRVDARNEPEQYARYDGALRSAHPTRLRYSARQFHGFELWPDLETVNAPAALAHAVTDTLHDPGGIDRMVRAVGAMHVPAPSDLYLHNREVIPDIDAFVATLPPRREGGAGSA